MVLFNDLRWQGVTNKGINYVAFTDHLLHIRQPVRISLAKRIILSTSYLRNHPKFRLDLNPWITATC